ncbi:MULTISPECIES: response regulator [unclassified Azospirillum]|uniref:response regulator n=1 Tax=unclassified Azospirillum TaxID=2630922 RepID=UPI0011ECB13D|nr:MULTISPECIES: response regulator [unclassified Azospirillum]KAA0581414.1 response regulator [Azospirillum sp. B21]HYF88867.1 response regulator [Azospirillum sp.]
MPDPLHILIAEDEVLAAMALEDFLSLKGFRVTVAANGAEALERYGREQVHALVTDLRMPRMDGQTLIREIRDRDAALPVVVMTGYLTEDSDLKHERWKPLEILSKPVNPRIICETLHRMLGLPLEA